MLVRWSSVLLVLAVSASVMPVAAAPLEGRLRADGPATLSGSFIGEATACGVGYTPAVDWESPVTLRGSFTVQLWSSREVEAGTGPDSPYRNWTATVPVGDELLRSYDAQGPLQVNPLSSDAWLLARGPGETVRFGLNADVLYTEPPVGDALGRLSATAFDPAPDGQPALPWTRPAHTTGLEVPPNVVARTFVYAAKLSWDGGEVTTGPQEDSAPEPMGLLQAHSRNHLYAMVLGTPSRIDWPVPPVAFLDQLEGTLDGNLTVTRVAADAQVNGTAIDRDAGLFQSTGTLELKTAWTRDGSSWDMKGDVTRLDIDNKAVIWFPEDVVPAAAVAVAATGLAALLLRFGPQLLALLSRVGRPHPTRTKVLHLLESGALPFSSIKRQLGVGRATARFHLAALERGGQVRRHRVGNADWFGLASAGALARVHPVRAQILASLGHGACTIPQLLQAWPSPIARTTLLYHLEAMKSEGIVQARRDGTAVRFALANRQILAHPPTSASEASA